jgi:hypothetical protein
MFFKYFCLFTIDNASTSEILHHEPKVRLVGGRDRSSGRLEIKLLSDTFYRPVCTTYWDEDDTKVVCRELGYR